MEVHSYRLALKSIVVSDEIKTKCVYLLFPLLTYMGGTNGGSLSVIITRVAVEVTATEVLTAKVADND